MSSLTLGAIPLEQDGSCKFRVWAPLVDNLCLEVCRGTEHELVPMQQVGDGYYEIVTDAPIGTHYYYYFNKLMKRPDPASRYQPEGVFGPSQVVSLDYAWNDKEWCGLPLEQYVIYELHVGLYTQAGTFEALIGQLDDLKDLGITAIELMPIGQFSGQRNWGYDGVFTFAVQNSYGGPDGLRKLVDACHARGMAVILDVIYNHFGPEGGFFGDFAPYFTSKYKTPWGNAINFDDAYNQHVRQYFIENALHWFTEYHIDALRLDAIQAIMDYSAKHFLAELAEHTKELAKKLQRHIYLIAESNLNDVRIISPQHRGGYNLDGQWNDDFHHALHSLITTERYGYYQDFGDLQHLVKAYRDGFVYSGEYSQFRKRPFGSISTHIPPQQFVVFAQNHDQVGNHYYGERFTQMLTLQQLKLIAAVLLLSPYIPLIFMGEEYAETAPFYFFVDFTDKNLISAVRKGRELEFVEMGLEGRINDPQDKAIFDKCKLQHNLKSQQNNKRLLNFYKLLLSLRKTNPVLANLSKQHMIVESDETQRTMWVKRVFEDQNCLLLFNFNAVPAVINSPLLTGNWQKLVDMESEVLLSEMLEIVDGQLEMPAYGFNLLYKHETL